jgi:hypothetical protein
MQLMTATLWGYIARPLKHDRIPKLLLVDGDYRVFFWVLANPII